MGGCCLIIDGDLVQGVPASFFRISAYLILADRAGVQPRHRLSALLWSQADEGKAAANMRQALARIRHLQDEHDFRFIEANFSTLHLPPVHDVTCDLVAFAQYMSGAQPLTPVQLCAVYGGELLAGLDPGGEGYEDWLAARRDQLLNTAIAGISAGVAADSGLTPADRVLCSRRLLEIDPYNEEALWVLMREAAERRQISRLNYLYNAMRTVLAEDLGIQPSQETRTLYTQLMQALSVS